MHISSHEAPRNSIQQNELDHSSCSADNSGNPSDDNSGNDDSIKKARFGVMIRQCIQILLVLVVSVYISVAVNNHQHSHGADTI